MKGKTLLSLAIVLSMVLGVLPFATVKAAPCTISVVFENGLNNITKAPCNNFIVSINIANAPNIDFFDIGIQWDPAVLELQTGTPADVVEGGFMKAFGSTVFPGPSVINIGSMPDIPCGFLTGGPAHGDGTLFTIAFHAKAPGDGAITIMDPNVVSFLLLGPALVNIDATVNGVVNIPLPPATPPKAIITSPVDASTVTVGDTVNLVGTASTPGYDTVPAPGETCPITIYEWTVDLHNGTVLDLFGATQSFVCGGPGLVTITLTVTAPDPTPPSAPTYVDHDSTSVSIMQVPAATGPNIDVYTDRGGQGPLSTYPFGWSDAYGPQEEVCVYAKVTYNGAPVEYKPVEFVIIDPFGAERESRTAFTNASGIAKVCFRIPWQGSDAEHYFGDWSIYGTVDISQVQVSDTVMYRFGYLLYIDSVTAGGPYHKGDTMTINVHVSSIAMADYVAFLQITAVDEADVPIGLFTAVITVSSSGLATGGTIVIPSWAYVGVGHVYVDLLEDGVWSGVPYCPEASAVFVIVYP